MKCPHKEEGRCKSCSNKERKGKYNWSEEAKENRKNEGNPNWNSDSGDYDTIHAWANRRLKKPDKCPECEKKGKLDLCHKDHSKGRSEDTYSRDLNEWIFLCRSCHMKADGRIKNLKQKCKNCGLVKGVHNYYSNCKQFTPSNNSSFYYQNKDPDEVCKLKSDSDSGSDFKLSDKIGKISVNGTEVLIVKDVKEFIRRLHLDMELTLKNANIIDKLAGDLK